MLKRRKIDAQAPEEFRRATSIIMDMVTCASHEELVMMLEIQNDLLRLTLENLRAIKN